MIMKQYIDYLLKEKKEVVSVTLIGVSILLVILMLLKITNYFNISQRAQSVVKVALATGVVQPAKVDLTAEMAIVTALTANNPFGILPASAYLTNPVREVNAIFGDKALINGGDAWYSVGDTIGGTARVVAIDPTQVTIEYNGVQSTYRPIDASIPSTQSSTRATPRGTQIQSTGSMVAVNSGGMMGRGAMAGNIQNMSQADIQRLRSQMTSQLGGGRGSGMGGMGGMGGGRGGAGGGRGGGMGGGRGGAGGGRGGRGG
jgi:hypothetical protein